MNGFEDELMEAVRDARPGLPDETFSAGGAQAQAVLERVLAARRGPGRARSGWRRALAGAPVVVTVAATVLVVAIAAITLRGHRPDRVARAGGRGQLVALDGHALSSKWVDELGLDRYYGRELRQGDTVKTSLDSSLERTGLLALAHTLRTNRPAKGGAFVALDPDNGQIYAIGGEPLGGEVQVAGPVGSAFTPITALAALESGAWSVGGRYDDTGQFCFAGQCRHNAGQAVDGVVDVTDALRVASNDFFYNLGALTDSPPRLGSELQMWAHAFGIGRPTGADLPVENAGTLPRAGGPAPGANSISLAVGQGRVRITPLQLAVAYAAIANGGTVVRPHLGLEVDRFDGGVVRAIAPAPARQLSLRAPDLIAVRAGLRAASSQPGGTSADVFAHFPAIVYGETGSARYVNQPDYAWYAGFIPASGGHAPLVVVVTVQQGGFGDVAAAPVARQIFSRWILGRPGPWVAGTSRTL